MARLGSKVLRRPATFAFLRAAVPESAEPSHRHYFVVLAVRHCTRVLDCNWQILAAAAGLVHSRIGIAERLTAVRPGMRLLVLGSTPNMPLLHLPRDSLPANSL